MKKCAILITAYKSTNYILETLKSIQACSLPANWSKEIFIGVDSCEETKDFLLENKYSCYYSACNVGTYILTNSLLHIAVNNKFDTYVRFDSDDIASETFLYNGLSALENRNFVRASYRKFENNGNYVGKNRIQGSYGCVFFDNKIVEALGGYRHYRVSCDKDFVLRAAYSGFSTAKIFPPAVYLYRQHSTSLTFAREFSKNSDKRASIEHQMEEMRQQGELKITDPVTTPLTYISC